MTSSLALISSAAFGFCCILWPQLLWITLMFSLFIASILLGVSGTITAHTFLSSNHNTTAGISDPSIQFTEFHKYISDSFNVRKNKPLTRLSVIFGRSVDIALQDLLDLTVRDVISPWLQYLTYNAKDLQYEIKSDIWLALSKLHERLTKIDETQLIAVDMITKVTLHFEKIRIAQANAVGDALGQFSLSHHLATPEEELKYLRSVSELILFMLFPRSTISHSLNKSLMVEVFACQVLAPFITFVTDPDYINQKILDYVEHVKKSRDLHMHSYTHAENYPEFLKVIRNTNDADTLKHIRYNIVTEIMQATTIQNLKRVKGLDKEKDQGNSRKLKRYLAQLAYAKSQCENRLQILGCPGFPSEHEGGNSNDKGVSLEVILESVEGRKRLSQFLEGAGQEGLLAYWAAVEELKTSERRSWHQLGAEIYYTFIHSPTAAIKVDKSVRRKMESFLLGDNGPDVFYEVQDDVVSLIQEKVYETFLTTEFYQLYLQDIEAAAQPTSGTFEESNLFLEDSEKDDTVVDQSVYARNKLGQLQERLNNKSQALQALRASLKPESKVLSGLEKEVENLEGEKRQLEAHLTRTEAWGEHLGKWRAVVQSAESPDDKEPPQFVLVVHVVEDDLDSDAVSTGWVVLRKLSEFHELHRKLSQVWSGVKQLELPTQSPKFIFSKQSDKSSLEKAKQQIQKYLEFVLQDEHLNGSEELYTFLSPSSEHFKLRVNGALSSPKKTRFSLSTLFKSSNQTGTSESSRDSDEEEISLLDDADGKIASAEARDAIAEPLYALLGEVFDLRGVFRWLRKTLITFVQITYGRTINRQVGETVAWLFSEPMVHYYIQLFTQAWWPNGVLIESSHIRTDEEKTSTKNEARIQFINNTPEVLNNLVGQQNARRGAVKVFETLQDVRLNKQLFYELFELLIYEIFPEIRKKPATASPLKLLRISK